MLLSLIQRLYHGLKARISNTPPALEDRRVSIPKFRRYKSMAGVTRRPSLHFATSL